MANFGARLECLKYKFNDTPEGEFIETLFAAQVQLERKQTGRQTRHKTKARLEAGYYAFIAPVGYKYVRPKSGGNVIVVDEAIRNILKEAMEGFPSGRFQPKIEVSRFFKSCARLS